MTRIKICGLTDQSDLDYAIAAGADAVGFIVEIERSRHCISAEAVKKLVMRVPVFAKSVAVIAPQDYNEAVRFSKETGADLLQVHGNTLSAKEFKALKEQVSKKIIAAVPSTEAEIHNLDGVADAVLLDTFKEGALGGTGETHDWDVSSALARRLRVPVILAGGLNSANVTEAIRKVRPYAVDVSSGVETGGKKDLQKMVAFVRAVRSCL